MAKTVIVQGSRHRVEDLTLWADRDEISGTWRRPVVCVICRKIVTVGALEKGVKERDDGMAHIRCIRLHRVRESAARWAMGQRPQEVKG